jgi:hypothetical protein
VDDGAVVEFRRRVAEIGERAEASSYDIRQFEHLLDDLLRFVLSHQEATSAFKAEFLRVLDSDELGAEEIVGFCMRSLRWPELQKGITERRDAVRVESAGRLRDKRRYWERLLEAFEDDWPNAILYGRYTSS